MLIELQMHASAPSTEEKRKNEEGSKTLAMVICTSLSFSDFTKYTKPHKPPAPAWQGEPLCLHGVEPQEPSEVLVS